MPAFARIALKAQLTLNALHPGCPRTFGHRLDVRSLPDRQRSGPEGAVAWAFRKYVVMKGAGTHRLHMAFQKASCCTESCAQAKTNWHKCRGRSHAVYFVWRL